uniref:Rho family-interacting cell polarization regulator 2 n=1 Tax=Geotrypetes seraphini TaxID=260995 RepID=A0A6P8Q3S0_GEOSA|nr:rho family-interacting cell polarization regulator 2 [Geotrypetes seraphini]
MSEGSQTFSLGGPNGILRSQSFAGFSGLPERRSRCNSFLGNSATPKKPQAKLKKMNNLGHKNCTPKQPQPERVEEVYGALKNGLDEYLEVHQKELDKLTMQLKDMRRNSRLGVLYELDKQIKAIERYIRRLEFHISKVDELYEAYCNRRRLREGACKMKQAFAMSPCSKAARESLSEINKSYKEYTENMCTVEAEMENLLGEFYIKMKGLAGFARLCPGDQYEIFMRYGRQRWKLKGKIEVNGKQSWDGEEMVFLPLINGLISIKVTELKGLATHILVGSVTCETKDLFAARPQVVAVDINDLGTVKLNLEVSWYPFDSEDLTPSTGNVNKAALQRRASIYSQGTPETPTFKEHSFFSNLPDDVFENGEATNEKRPLSLSFGDLHNGDCTPPSKSTASSVALGVSNPEITITPPGLTTKDMTSNHPSTGNSSTDPVLQEKDLPTPLDHLDQREEAKAAVSSVSHEHPAPASDNLFLDTCVSVSLLQDPDEVSELKPVELDTSEGNITKQLVKRLTSTEGPRTQDKPHYEGSVSCESEGYKSYLDGSLEEALQGLLLALEPHKDLYKEFQALEQKLMDLEDILKCKPVVNRSRSSSISLTVESALESFDFLNTSDFEDEIHVEEEEVCISGGADSVFSDTETEKSSYRLDHSEARGHLSEALTEDTGVGTSVAGSPLPLTTGNESLDISLVRHLQYCTHLVQQIMCSGKAALVIKDLLDRLAKQILVLEKLAQISAENMGNLNSVTEAIPGFHKKQSLLSFWAKCSGPTSVYHTTTDKMMRQLDASFAEIMNEECPGFAEKAFRTLVTQILDQVDPVICPSLASEVITVFQYYNFFTSQNVSDLRNYIVHLAKEASLLQILQSSKDNSLLQDMRDRAACDLSPQPEILRALALLLSEGDSEASQAEKLLLSNAGNSLFRKKALVYYCEALTHPDPHLQKAAQLALKCLQDTESIYMLVTLCQSHKEEVRKVASETLLSLGEDGRLAYEQLDKLSKGMVKSGACRGTSDATAF